MARKEERDGFNIGCFDNVAHSNFGKRKLRGGQTTRGFVRHMKDNRPALVIAATSLDFEGEWWYEELEPADEHIVAAFKRHADAEQFAIRCEQAFRLLQEVFVHNAVNGCNDTLSSPLDPPILINSVSYCIEYVRYSVKRVKVMPEGVILHDDMSLYVPIFEELRRIDEELPRPIGPWREG